MDKISENRIFYLDYIKICLTVLVILHHGSITYGGSGSWYFVEPTINSTAEFIFAVFNSVNQSYFMGFFFMIAAYFTAKSLKHKPVKAFIWKKVSRLGLPLLCYFFLIGPFTRYIAAEGRAFRYADSLHPGPLWFIAALLIFDFSTLFVRSILRGGKRKERNYPSHRKIFLYLFLFGIGTFFVRLLFPIGKTVLLGFQLGHFPYYILFYLAGYVGYENNWFSKIERSHVTFWLKVSLITFLLFFPFFLIAGGPEPFYGGLSFYAFAASFWDGFVAVGIMLLYLYIAGKYFNRPIPILQLLSRNNFTAYVFHAPVVTSLGISLSVLPLTVFGKFLLLSILSVSLSYLLGIMLLTRIPGIKRVFG